MTPSTTVEYSENFSGNSRSRLKKNTLWFRYLAVINLIFGAWYLQWRITSSINFQPYAVWLSILLLLAEIYSYVGGVMFIIGLWRPLERQVKSIDRLKPAFSPSKWPTVDVFVTCYSEPVEIVEETSRAALAMDYPVTKLRVYILDDGNSPEMRAMAQKLAIEDLQSPLLQQEAHRLELERSHLVARLHEINSVDPDIQSAEGLLQEYSSNHGNGNINNSTAMRFLYSLRRLMLLVSPDSTSVSDRLEAERKITQDAIDQKDLELTELARMRYIARPKPPGVPHHAKAGNINYAMFSGETSGELIVTLDADHIPKPHFIKRVVPYFFTYNVFSGQYEKNKIALVQTEQDFYNLPAGDPFGHSAHLFYGPIQQGKDGMNAAFYTGTNAMIRREALVTVGLQYFSDEYSKDQKRLDEFELVGGVSSNSITEDMNTAMRLHGAGWQTVYHNELLAEGLAPDDLSSTMKQKLRWAQGTIQVLQRENPFNKPGLTFWQRLQYFQTMYSYFAGFFIAIFIACPIIYFYTGIIPVRAYGPDFVIHFIPGYIINRLTFIAACWGIPAGELWRSEQYAIAYFPLYIKAVWSVLSGQPMKFVVTPKQRQSGNFLGLVRIQLGIFLFTFAGMVLNLVQFALNQLSDPGAHLINAAWALYNLSLLWAVVRAAVWQPPKSAT